MNTTKALQEELERQGMNHLPPVTARPSVGQLPLDMVPVRRPHPRTFDRWRKKGLVFSESDPSPRTQVEVATVLGISQAAFQGDALPLLCPDWP